MEESHPQTGSTPMCPAHNYTIRQQAPVQTLPALPFGTFEPHVQSRRRSAGTDPDRQTAYNQAPSPKRPIEAEY